MKRLVSSISLCVLLDFFCADCRPNVNPTDARVDVGFDLGAGPGPGPGFDPTIPPPDYGPPMNLAPFVAPFDEETVTHVRALRAVGVGRGARLNVFAKIGDSITESASFFGDIGHGWHVMGAYTALTPTVNFFRAQTLADGANSFGRASSCAMGGWVSEYALSMEPRSALRRELDFTHPGYVILMYGTNDLDRVTSEAFVGTMGRIIDVIDTYGAVTILSTIPDRTDRPDAAMQVPVFNDAIRTLASTRHLPLMDFWFSLQSLPNKGVSQDGIHPSAYTTRNATACGVLSPEGLQFGYNMRNLVALYALDRVRAIQ
jgi:hypothetical protein